MKKSLEDYTRMMRGQYASRTRKRALSALLSDSRATTGLEEEEALDSARRRVRWIGGT